MVANSLVVALALASAAIVNVSVAQAPSQAAAVPTQAPAGAPPAQLKPDSRADARAEVAAHIQGVRAEDLRATPVPGVFELTRGADIAYVSADGKYGFTGDLYELGSNNNLTEHHRRELRVKAIAAFPESEMLIFGPKDPKYTVTVFTDIDCPYCRQLHSQMADYNRLGIRVRYLLYPRTGPNTASWTKAQQVWCSANRNEALTRAKLGEQLKSPPCTNTPVARSYALGDEFGLTGTPAILMADGELLTGYVPPDALAKRLQDGH